MVNPKDLIPGRVYFFLLFYDENLSIPKIRTLVYIGNNVFGEKYSTTALKML